MARIITIFLLLSLSTPVFSARAWYTGKVNRVALYDSDGSFVVTFEGASLDDCLYKYAYFSYTQLGEGRLKNAYTMALMSLSTNMTMGVVIDKTINGANGKCYPEGMTSDLRKDV